MQIQLRRKVLFLRLSLVTWTICCPFGLLCLISGCDNEQIKTEQGLKEKVRVLEKETADLTERLDALKKEHAKTLQEKESTYRSGLAVANTETAKLKMENATLLQENIGLNAIEAFKPKLEQSAQGNRLWITALYIIVLLLPYPILGFILVTWIKSRNKYRTETIRVFRLLDNMKRDTIPDSNK
jgi:hypothetical protein